MRKQNTSYNELRPYPDCEVVIALPESNRMQLGVIYQEGAYSGKL